MQGPLFFFFLRGVGGTFVVADGAILAIRLFSLLRPRTHTPGQDDNTPMSHLIICSHSRAEPLPLLAYPTLPCLAYRRRDNYMKGKLGKNSKYGCAPRPDYARSSRSFSGEGDGESQRREREGSILSFVSHFSNFPPDSPSPYSHFHDELFCLSTLLGH